jgi:hypothetical protein
MRFAIGALARTKNEQAAGVAFPWDFATIARECPRCGEPVPLLRRTCPNCRGKAKLGAASLILAGSLVVLIAAGLASAVALVRWQKLEAATATGAAAEAIIAATSSTDFSWLATAMSGCDDVAKNDPSTLHFLVTPLTLAGSDPAPWRAKSINSKGDGILLRAGDAIAGLKQASLRIFPGDYAFSFTDEATRAVYRWRAAVGVARFANAEAPAVSSFQVQFRTVRGNDPEWGTMFNRQDGSCYWVNPVIGQ